VVGGAVDAESTAGGDTSDPAGPWSPRESRRTTSGCEARSSDRAELAAYPLRGAPSRFQPRDDLVVEAGWVRGKRDRPLLAPHDARIVSITDLGLGTLLRPRDAHGLRHGRDPTRTPGRFSLRDA
jgi:hypothetical protein